MQINNFTPGPVRFVYYIDAFNGPVHPIYGRCWQWKGPINKYFGRAVLRADGKNWIAARYAWFLEYGEDPGDLCVCHKCDNKLCVRIDHLFLGTLVDNIMDMVQKGRQSKGESNRHKLSSDEVAEIRRTYVPRKNGRQLAAQYGVKLNQIVLIAKGKSRRHDGFPA